MKATFFKQQPSSEMVENFLKAIEELPKAFDSTFYSLALKNICAAFKRGRCDQADLSSCLEAMQHCQDLENLSEVAQAFLQEASDTIQGLLPQKILQH